MTERILTCDRMVSHLVPAAVSHVFSPMQLFSLGSSATRPFVYIITTECLKCIYVYSFEILIFLAYWGL